MFQWVTWVNFKVSVGTVSETFTQRFQERLNFLLNNLNFCQLGSHFRLKIFLFYFIIFIIMIFPIRSRIWANEQIQALSMVKTQFFSLQNIMKKSHG